MTTIRTALARVAPILRRRSIIFFLAWIVLWIYFCWHPVLIYARGYSATYWFTPLSQFDEADVLSVWSTTPDYDMLNWDGDTLHIDYMYQIPEPAAPTPAGDFVVAALPQGFAIGRQDVDQPTWGSMRDISEPWIIPYIAIAVIPLAIVALKWICRELKKRPGHCHHCNYNLTGNTTGICPECGTPTQPEPPPSLTQGD